MILLRRILFYSFTLSYVLICPLIILYAFGYILRPNSEKGMIKTGLISLATVPAGANVYIENKRYLNKTPTVIPDLIPGNYSLSLALKDSHPASRVISVEAGKASVFERTVLLPRKWDFRVLVQDNFEAFIPLAGTHLFLLAKGSRLKYYVVYNWRREIAWPLLGAGHELNNAKVLSYAQAKGSNFIFMHLVLGNKEMFVRFELRDKLTRADELTRFFYKLPLGIKWDHTDPDNIFVLEDNHLNRIGIAADGLSPKYIDGVLGYAISDKMIYLFGPDDVITEIDYEKRKSEIIYDGAKKDNPVFKHENNFIIEPLSKESVIFCPELGELFLNFGSYGLLEKKLEGVEFDPESKRLAAWQENKIGVLELLKVEKEDLTGTYEPRLAWIFNEGGSITQCFWVYKGSHLIFLDSDKVYLLGIEGELNPNLAPLFEVKRNSAIFYNAQNGRLYYLDPATGGLFCVQIIPE